MYPKVISYHLDNWCREVFIWENGLLLWLGSPAFSLQLIGRWGVKIIVKRCRPLTIMAVLNNVQVYIYTLPSHHCCNLQYYCTIHACYGLLYETTSYCVEHSNLVQECHYKNIWKYNRVRWSILKTTLNFWVGNELNIL